MIDIIPGFWGTTNNKVLRMAGEGIIPYDRTSQLFTLRCHFCTYITRMHADTAIPSITKIIILLS